jgi:uncharacterized membrane protein
MPYPTTVQLIQRRRKEHKRKNIFAVFVFFCGQLAAAETIEPL